MSLRRLPLLLLFSFTGNAYPSSYRQELCSNPPNDVVAENCLPGSPPSEWDVNGAGHDDVQGFSTRASVAPGERAVFKVKLHPASPALRVDIYRAGHYAGLGARRVGHAELLEDEGKAREGGGGGGINAALSQPACSTANGVDDCGNWGDVAAWTVPQSAVSGLYFARFVVPSSSSSSSSSSNWRTDASRIVYDPNHAMAGRDPLLPPPGAGGRHAYGAAGKNRLRNALAEPVASHAWFVVRSAPPPPSSERGVRTPFRGVTHDLLFQTADTVWQAYNGWGGLTTYGSFDFPRRHAPGRELMHEDARQLEASRLERAHKRSYNTPLTTREYRAVNAPLGCELPAIMFLEGVLGVRVHYATGADLGTAVRGPALLGRSRAYLSVGHDEYWSYRQRANVEAARDNGLHLNFWSGNEAYWAVRFEDSLFPERRSGSGGAGSSGGKDEASDEPPRTMVCYKETQSVEKLDPAEGSWTGTFRDARPLNPKGALPENALTGHMFAANAQRQDLLTVDAAKFGLHRMWRHTSVAALARAFHGGGDRGGGGDRAGSESCSSAAGTAATATDRRCSPSLPATLLVFGPRGVLGHEWDEDVDNGFRPPHLQRLSETTVDNVQVIMDYGSTFDTGSATHSLVLHRRQAGGGGGGGAHPSSTTSDKGGALVFGAGTVQWSWALAGLHDVNDPPRANKYDTRVEQHADCCTRDLQQLTVNVLGDMGVRMPALPPPSLSTSTRATTAAAISGGGGGHFMNHPHELAALVAPEPSSDATAPTKVAVEAAELLRVGDGDDTNSAEPNSGSSSSSPPSSGKEPPPPVPRWAIAARGTVADGGGGCVASVELSWRDGEWHPADLAAVAPLTSWSLSWGGEPWQLLHGAAPQAGDAISVRASDDSGNTALFPRVALVAVVVESEEEVLSLLDDLGY